VQDLAFSSDSAQSLSDERRVSGVHLVGSIPLADAEGVFRRVSAELGDRLRRIPDGETGPRADWIIWQYPVLSSRPEFEICPPGPEHYRALPRLRLGEGVSAGDITFERLGYAQTAIASYRLFATLKRDGIRARVDDWYEFLSAYHDAGLGWVGGNEKVGGRAPTAEDIADRLSLIRQATDTFTLFGGRTEFDACWTYINCTR